MTRVPDVLPSHEQTSVVSDALIEWCAQNSIDPEGPRGRAVAHAMNAMYQSGKIWRHELMAYGKPRVPRLAVLPTR